MGYQIDYYETASDVGSTVNTTELASGSGVGMSLFTTDLHITLTGLSNNTIYDITVAAVNGAGVSPFTAFVTTAIPSRNVLYSIYVSMSM